MQIQACSDTPFINFNEKTCVLEIIGRSFPENAKEFYKPVLTWVKKLKLEANNQYTCKINLEYFNTASSKFLLELFQTFYTLQTKYSVPVTVEWIYENEDKDMKEAGEEFAQIVSIPFIFTIDN